MTEQESPAVDLSREGSAYDALHGRRRSKKVGRRVRGWISDRATDLAAVVIPWLYRLYCRFVWATSRVDHRLGVMERGVARHGRGVALLWHQEVFSVAWAYGYLRATTLASVGKGGRIITHMLETCGYKVFRGGSSKGTARRRQVVSIMIRHMKSAPPPLLYGITVDGSHGPVYRMKHGGPLIARSARAPIYLVRTWYARRFEAPTWDRTGIPLPFNRIVQEAIGPYWVDPEGSAEDFKRTCEHLEAELMELCDKSYREVDGRPDLRARADFGAGWTPRWSPLAPPGLKLSPWDLDEDHPPPWAHLPGASAADDGRRRPRRARRGASDREAAPA